MDLLIWLCFSLPSGDSKIKTKTLRVVFHSSVYPLLTVVSNASPTRRPLTSALLSNSEYIWVLAPDFRSLPLLILAHKSISKRNSHLDDRRVENFRKLRLESAVVQNRGRRNSQESLAGLGLTPRLPLSGIPSLLRIAGTIAVNNNISSPSPTLPAMLAAAHSAATQSLNAGNMQDSSWADVSNLENP